MHSYSVKQKKKNILVAMSGGVDSSVSAALLVKQGHAVTGAFMKQWSDTRDVHGVCQWKQDRRDALRVAAHLGIPLHTFDFEREYTQWVMEYMFKEYEVGRTPNPDVLCNKYIKFGAWLDEAQKRGFDAMATGHYARIKEKSGAFHLQQAKDSEKDQTYFLHQLNQEQLSRTLFPIGDYLKSDVRKLAARCKLPTADRKESMGICFVGNVPMKDFLLQKIKPKKGNIVTTGGAVVGEHDGLPFYTIGQRHIGSHSLQKGGDTKALYVVAKKQDTNELIVGFEDDPALFTNTVHVTDMHWTAGSPFAKAPEDKRADGQEATIPLQCEVRLRHRQELQRASFDGTVLTFSSPQKAATPGQFAVLYQRGECLGGGVIT